MNSQQPISPSEIVGAKRTCKNCPRTFILTEPAPHKRFCSSTCRVEWHNNQRKLGLQALAQLQQPAPAPSQKNGEEK